MGPHRARSDVLNQRGLTRGAIADPQFGPVCLLLGLEEETPADRGGKSRAGAVRARRDVKDQTGDRPG